MKTWTSPKEIVEIMISNYLKLWIDNDFVLYISFRIITFKLQDKLLLWNFMYMYISIPLNTWTALFKDGACSFPPLWDGEWYDSLHGDVTFNSTLSTVTGWAYTAYNQLVTPFTCVSENTTSNQLLFMWVCVAFKILSLLCLIVL